MAELQPGWRRAVCAAVSSGVAVPSMSSALAYFDGYRTANGPANVLQAQRDYFGAHTVSARRFRHVGKCKMLTRCVQYERVDKPRGEYFHTNWTGTGGTTASSTYNA